MQKIHKQMIGCSLIGMGFVFLLWIAWMLIAKSIPSVSEIIVTKNIHISLPFAVSRLFDVFWVPICIYPILRDYLHAVNTYSKEALYYETQGTFFGISILMGVTAGIVQLCMKTPMAGCGMSIIFIFFLLSSGSDIILAMAFFFLLVFGVIAGSVNGIIVGIFIAIIVFAILSIKKFFIWMFK